jgi:hypothetical protein
MIVFKLSEFDGVRVLLVTEAVPGKLYAKPNKYIAEVPLELKLSAPRTSFHNFQHHFKM